MSYVNPPKRQESRTSSKLFGEDSAVMRALRACCDIALLNLLWLVCSLPLFTIGAATAALYACLIARARGESAEARAFFRVFSVRFRRATALWLIALFAAIVLFADYRFSLTLSSAFRFWCIAIYIALGLSLLLALPFLFLPPALNERTILRAIKTAFYFSIKQLPRTIAMLALWLIPPLGLIVSPYWFLRFGWVWIGFGFGAIASLCIKLIQKPLGITPNL